jgi:hypothetical protein
LPEQGRTFTFERKAGKVIAALDEYSGIGPLVFQLPAAVAGVNRLLPGKPLKVGDKWSISNKTAVQARNSVKIPDLRPWEEEDLPEFKGEGRLAKAYTKGGTRFWVLVFRFQTTLYHLDITIDAPIDGSSPALKVTAKASGGERFVQERSSAR